MIINVAGISSRGDIRTISYLIITESNTYSAIKKALDCADCEYNCEYDENMKPIPDSGYKEFETITSIEVIND